MTDSLRNSLLGLALVAAVALAYARTASFEYLLFDDPGYVIDTPQVLGGITLQNMAWAFATFKTANYHPLTWLSLQSDATLFGNHPAVRHLVNVGLHAANAVLLFLFLARITGRVGAAACVAALFALHPTNVESVAWVSERKNVLCTFFWLLASFAYVHWTKTKSLGSYLLTCGLFLLSLLAKPMAVTFPCALLLLDYWPLGRLESQGQAAFFRTLWRRIREKLPLLVLTTASCVITYIAQDHGGAVQALHRLGLGARAANALLGYLAYLTDLAAPFNLAPLYPLPKALAGWKIATAGLTLAGLTALAWRYRHKERAALVGWLWYLGTLAPMIGLVQVGAQARADRYLYIPAWGLFMIAAYCAPRRVLANRASIPALLALLALLGVGTWRQTGIWQNNEALVARMAVLDDQPGMLYNQAYLLQRQGRFAEAEAAYKKTLALSPRHAGANNNLGGMLLDAGRYEEAVQYLDRALKTEPTRYNAALNLGMALFELRRFEEAAAATAQAVQLNPKEADGQANMGFILLALNRRQEALEYFTRALELDPANAQVRDAIEAVKQGK